MADSENGWNQMADCGGDQRKSSQDWKGKQRPVKLENKGTSK